MVSKSSAIFYGKGDEDVGASVCRCNGLAGRLVCKELSVFGLRCREARDRGHLLHDRVHVHRGRNRVDDQMYAVCEEVQCDHISMSGAVCGA